MGLVVVVIGMSFGGMHGYAINPARDFGPRLFTVLPASSNNGLTDGTNQFLVPLVAPLVGGLAGARCTKRHRPDPPAELESRRMSVTRRQVFAAMTAASYGRFLARTTVSASASSGYGLIGAQHVFDFKNQKDVDMVAMSDTYQPRLEQGVAACGGKPKVPRFSQAPG